ncbi:uncharacterized protein LOC111947113 [Oryzias latipes]|uniref:uncharacterized protein LOC111947113 n=1 Tax=Oryzias latipes TaxID=8090 RepID=UPI000CE20B83|nr:uncharacterized protein LOC111947113 [Oryzias latipes]
MNITELIIVNMLRSILRNISYPLSIKRNTQINQSNITTVCTPINNGHQCICEDQYRWSCDQCLMYGACDQIFAGSCGCINTIPSDRNFCQSLYQHSKKFETVLSFCGQTQSQIKTNFIPVPIVFSDFTDCLPTTHLPPTTHLSPTTYLPPTTPNPPPAYKYVLSVEMNITDLTTVNMLRSILRNISYPLSIKRNTQINQSNITTVCTPINNGHQCICEDQYRWSCDQCLMYGACDQIFAGSCGCINTIPSDRNFCQSLYQHSKKFETVLSFCGQTQSQIKTNFIPVPIVFSDFTDCLPTTHLPPTTHLSPTTYLPPTTPNPPPAYKYVLSVEMNITELTTVNMLRSILRNISYPLSIKRNTQINQSNITTVCTPINNGHQCICEDQYRWSCDQCLMYGACDQISAGSCGCINAIPSDRNFCQSLDQHNFTHCLPTTHLPPTTHLSPTTYLPPTTPNPPPAYKYVLSVEMNITELRTVNMLRSILRNISYPLSIKRNTQINQSNITTVCTPINNGHQCICEDQYRWSCDQCLMYGACDQIFAGSCGCINAIPSDRNFCQSLYQHSKKFETVLSFCGQTQSQNKTNFIPVPIVFSDFNDCLPTTHLPPTTHLSPTTYLPPTTPNPPPAYKYVLSVEMNITELRTVNMLRSILRNISYPLSIKRNTQINQSNITTVCTPINNGHQCICEDQYRWSCDQCLMYGACDQIFAGSCGCINAIPSDRNFCQSLYQHSKKFETVLSFCGQTQSQNKTNFIPVPIVFSDFNDCLPTTHLPPTTHLSPTTYLPPTTPNPPPAYKYVLSVEMNITELRTVNMLRSILRNISYPLSIKRNTQINQSNITTVCTPINNGHQCICEDQYRWSCDQCLMYGACDQISAGSCGCINAIPSDRNFCQSLDQHSKKFHSLSSYNTFTTYNPFITYNIFTTYYT